MTILHLDHMILLLADIHPNQEKEVSGGTTGIVRDLRFLAMEEAIYDLQTTGDGLVRLRRHDRPGRTFIQTNQWAELVAQPPAVLLRRFIPVAPLHSRNRTAVLLK